MNSPTPLCENLKDTLMVIRINPRRIITVLMTAYLMNVFYFNMYETVQKVLLWFLVGVYLALNARTVSEILNKHFLRYFKKKMVLLLFLTWGILILLTPFLHGTRDFSYFGEYITIVTAALYCLAICVRIYKTEGENDLAEKFMRIFVYAMVLYIFSSIVAIVFPPYREFIINNVSMSDYARSVIQIEKYRTRIGFAGLSVFSSGIKCAFANLFVLFFGFKNLRKKNRIGMKIWVLYLLTILGEFLYSRTSLLLSIIFLILFVVMVLTKLGRITKFIEFVLLIFFAASIVILLIGQFEGDNASLAWQLEVFTNMSNGRGFNATSLNIMRRMAFVPDISTLLFGDGRYAGVNGGYYMSTDLGYMRSILYYGLIGLLFVVILIVATLKTILKIRKEPEYSMLAIMSFIAFVVFEIKGECMGVFYPVIFTLMCCTSYSNEESHI